MPFGLIVIGIILAIAAYRDTLGELFSIIKDVSRDAKGFGYWVIAAVILGFAASIKPIKEPVNAFMILLMIVLLIRKRGAIDQITNQLKGN
ncbi:tail tube DNA translocation protein [Enterobacteria phage PRDwine]